MSFDAQLEIGKGKPYDVVNNYSWTTTTNPEALALTPVIKLTEYQQTVAAIKASIEFWAGQARGVTSGFGWDTNQSTAQNIAANGKAAGKLVAGGAETDAYAGLYQAKPTGNIYSFPFYNVYNHVVTNNWGQNKGPIGEAVEGFLTPVGKIGKPSAGIEAPKAWEGTGQAAYSFTFQLLNTLVNGKSNQADNKALCDELIKKNLQYRINAVTSFPPVFYTVEIPGVRTSPAAHMSNLTISNIGHMVNRGGANIPEAYEITIQIAELITESRQIFTGKTKIDTAVNRVPLQKDAAAADTIPEQVINETAVLMNKTGLV